MIKIDSTQTLQEYKIVVDQYTRIGFYDGKNNDVRNANEREASKLEKKLAKEFGKKNVNLKNTSEGFKIQIIGEENKQMNIKRNYTLE